MPLSDAQLQEVWDRQQITSTLARYCHGIDRLDRGMLETVYWPDGFDDHMSYKGPAPGFIDWVMTLLKSMNKTRHFIGNILIEFDSATTAHSETYVQAYHQVNTTFGLEEFTVGARFLDIHEKRNGEWRIFSRTLCVDHSTHVSAHENARYKDAPNIGQRYPNDPYYTVFSK